MIGLALIWFLAENIGVLRFIVPAITTIVFALAISCVSTRSLTPTFQNDTLVLRSPIEVGGTKIDGKITKQQIESLLHQKVTIGTDESDGYNFLVIDSAKYNPEKPADGRLRVETCNAYFAAKARGASAMTTFDRAMEGWFCKSCETLRLLTNAARAQKTLLEQDILPNLYSLPASMLPFKEAKSGLALNQGSERGKSIADYRSRGLKIMKQDRFALSLEYDGSSVLWREMARADFNRDGFEDVLLLESGHYIGGSGGWTSHVLITKTNRTAHLLQKIKSQ